MLLLDANILIRAVLGRRVEELLQAYDEEVTFLAPETAFEEALEHVPRLLEKRGESPRPPAEAFEDLRRMVTPVRPKAYGSLEAKARRRLDRRDPDDWPVLACALRLRCPIWTEDRDFFGVGVATWTTDRVELFLTGD